MEDEMIKGLNKSYLQIKNVTWMTWVSRNLISRLNFSKKMKQIKVLWNPKSFQNQRN